MNQRPYTDDDLRAEAAGQYRVALSDPDFMGIGEQMDGSFIESTVIDPDPETGTEPVTGRTWDQLAGEDFADARRRINAFLESAADVSEWAINLGADGLEPSDEHVITVNADNGVERPIVRIHFAFKPGMDDDTRNALVEGIGHAINAHI